MQHPSKSKTTNLTGASLNGCAFSRLESQANEAATGANDRAHPTPAQAAAGNYKLGSVTLHGLQIMVENVRNSVRSGVGGDGKAWSNRVNAHYGYFSGTKGADGDGVDVFIGPFPESKDVWVINQRGARGAFDEHKVMLGFHAEQQARDAYQHSYDRDWRGLMSIVPATVTQLRWWLRHGDMKRAISADQLPHEGKPIMDKVHWDSNAEPASTQMHKLIYALRQHDGKDGLLLDAATMTELMTDPDVEAMPMLDALVVEVGRLKQKMTLLQGVMSAAGGTVKPTDFTISDPVKMRGALHIAVLFAMGDGQSVSIWFHNPDTTPNKLTPMDELISWKWMLNKKDVTIVVAPERGIDLNVREVARRIMRLVEKNSEAFTKANAKSAERAAQGQALDDEIASLTTELASVQRDIEVAKVEAEPYEALGFKNKADHDANMAAAKAVVDDEPSLPEGSIQEIQKKLELTPKTIPAQGLLAEKNKTDLVGGFSSDGWYAMSNGAKASPGFASKELAEKYISQLQVDNPEYQRLLDKISALAIAQAKIPRPADSRTPAVTVTGTELGEFPDTPEGKTQLRLVAIAAYEAMLGEMAPCPALGGEVELRKSGMLKVKSLSGNPRKLKLIPALKRLIGGASLLTSGPSYDPTETSIKAYHILRCEAAIGEDMMAVRLVIKEDEKGQFHWDHTIHAPDAVFDSASSQEKGPDVSGPISVTTTNGGAGQTGATHFARHQLAEIVIDDASLVNSMEVLNLLFDGVNGEGPAAASPSIFLGGNRGCTHNRSAMPEPTRLLPAEPSAGQQDNETLLDDAGGVKLLSAVVNLFIEGEAPELAEIEEVDPLDVPSVGGKTAADFTVIKFADKYRIAGASNMNPFSPSYLTEAEAGQALVIYLATSEFPVPTEQPIGFDTNGISAVLKSNGWVDLGGKSWDRGAWKVWVRNFGDSDSMTVGTYADGRVKPVGDVKFVGRDGGAVVAEIEKIITANMKVNEPDLPDPEQADYAKFDPSKIKMPSAMALGLSKLNGLVLTQESPQAEPAPGWSNGHLLDLAQRPKIIADAIVKYFVDTASQGIRRASEATIGKLVSAAKSRNVRVEPLSFYDMSTAGKNDPSKGKFATDLVKVPSVVLANEDEGVVVTVDRRYFSYFFKTYKGCEFFTSDGGDESMAVKHQGVLVGIIMPLRGADEKTLKRAKQAANPAPSHAGATDPAELSPIVKVDQAYKFGSATDRFKEYIAETVGEADYSMFASAKAMDESAKALGATISWDVEETSAMDSVDSGDGSSPQVSLFDSAGEYRAVLDAAATYLSIVGRISKDGEIKGRALIGGDGKAMVYVGIEGMDRVTFRPSGSGEVIVARWSDDDAALMVGWLLNPPADPALTDPNIGREWDSSYGRQKIVGIYGGDLYQVNTVGTDTVRRYRIDDIENVIRTDEYRLTPEFAAEQAHAAEVRRLDAENEARAAVVAAKRDAEIAEFTTAMGMTVMNAERARLTLIEMISSGGNVMSRKDLVEDKVGQGFTTSLVGGSMALAHADGRFIEQKKITKTAVDYASWVVGKKAIEASEASDQEDGNIAVLRAIVAGESDDSSLSLTLATIETCVTALNEHGLLVGDVEQLAQDAITRWARVDEKVNG